MKQLIIISLILLSCQCCGKRPSEQQKEIWIEYTAESRGSFIRYYVNPNYLKIQSQGLNTYEKEHKLHKNSWSSLDQLIQASQYENWSEIAPQDPKYQVDASAIGTLILQKNGKRYMTVAFDHEQPPEQLKPIVNKILELADSVE